MLKIINKFRSMLIARRIQKTCRIMKKARGHFDELIEKSCRLTFYIKPGYQEPTIFVGVATIDGKEHIISIFNFGVIPASKIVEAVEMIQSISISPKPPKCPMLFAVGDNNMSSFLQDKGVDNVVIATNEDYKRILKAVDTLYKENK